ncbi:monooxygenase [Xylaria digitata]|nr:monooxygenase [Xylaria digitata]
MSKPAPIAIVGGGPCGFTFARLLECAGIDYVVFERDSSAAPSTHHQGGSLDLHTGTGLAALEAAGLKTEFDRYARYEGSVFTVQDSKGENRFTTTPADGGGKEERPEIDRRQLRGLLLDSLPAHRVRWGKVLEVLERADGSGEGSGEGWVLKFADGSWESGFRLVVGADGAFSAVRSVITPAKPIYSGKASFEGRISQSNPQYAAALEMVGPGNSVATGDGLNLVVQQMADRTYRIYAGVVEPDTSLTRAGGILDFTTDVEKSRSALLDRFAGWAPHLRAFIENAEGPWRVWSLYTFTADVFAEGSAWTRAPGVTLLGDAAHVALPNGEGVNLAMLDALKLFERLTAELGSGQEAFDAVADATAIERAITTYEIEMRKRAAEHVDDGIMMNDIMFKADGAERLTAFFKGFAEGGQS